MKKILASFLVTMGLGMSAQAGLLLEPYLGYEQGASKGDYTANPALSFVAKSTGNTIGARIGYKLPLMFWFAADYSITNGNNKAEYVDPANNDTAKFSRTSLYATAGFDFIILVRGYVGYALANNETDKFTTFESKLKGGGYKMGVGFTGLPFVSLNLEYITNTWTDIDTGSGSSKVSDSYGKFENSAVMLGVSMPFNL